MVILCEKLSCVQFVPLADCREGIRVSCAELLLRGIKKTGVHCLYRAPLVGCAQARNLGFICTIQPYFEETCLFVTDFRQIKVSQTVMIILHFD